MSDTEKKLPATLEERAREAVNAALGTIYTDEELDAMVRSEVDRFFTKPIEQFKCSSKRRFDKNFNSQTIDYWHECIETPLSPFQLIVWNMCATLVLNRIVETSKDPGLGITTLWESSCDEMGNTTSMNVTEFGSEIQKRAEALAEQNMHRMFAQMFAGMMTQAKSEMMAEFYNRFSQGQYQNL